MQRFHAFQYFICLGMPGGHIAIAVLARPNLFAFWYIKIREYFKMLECFIWSSQISQIGLYLVHHKCPEKARRDDIHFCEIVIVWPIGDTLNFFPKLVQIQGL